MTPCDMETRGEHVILTRHIAKGELDTQLVFNLHVVEKYSLQMRIVRRYWEDHTSIL